MDFTKLFSGSIEKIVGEVSSGLDGLFTSDEERLQAKNILQKINNELVKQSQQHDEQMAKEITKRIDMQKSVIIAELNGESWMQRNWRAMTMLTFTFIIANFYIIQPFASAIFSVELGAKKLEPEMWELLKIGMGGYIVALGGKKMLESSKWSK